MSDNYSAPMGSMTDYSDHDEYQAKPILPNPFGDPKPPRKPKPTPPTPLPPNQYP